MMPTNVIPFRPRRRRAGNSTPQHWLEVLRAFWTASFDRLADYVERLQERELTRKDLRIVAPKGEPIIVMTRTFAAPKALVFKAMSQPEHVVRWWGPNGHVNQALEYDFRVGGKWRIRSDFPEGGGITFFGEFRAIEPGEVITQTFAFEGLPPGQYSLDTVILTEIGDRTLYAAVSVLPDLAARDGMIASGMETGVVEGFERLDGMLEAFKLGQ